MTLVALVSDTHDNMPLTHAAAAFLRARHPDRVFHLGDITGVETVRAFEGLPVQFLCGNNDVPDVLAPALDAGGFPPLLPAWTGDIDGIRVGATHGHMRARLLQLQGACDVVLHGHTHRRRAEHAGGALTINPGALHRATTRTLALLGLPDKTVEFFEVRADGVTAIYE